MQNLNSTEIAEWKSRCAIQRSIARANPCTEAVVATCSDFETKLGPWNLRLFLATWRQPHVWVGSISYFKQIGDETVYDKATGLPIFEVPQDALMCVKDWTHEEKDIAKSLLADLFGPLIHDKAQPVMEAMGMFGLNWVTKEADARRVAVVEN